MKRVWGKIIGAILGGLLGRWPGLIVGLLVGHAIDEAFAGRNTSSYSRVQADTVFFNTLFALMGHLGKADGRVSEHEIALAEQVMARFSFNARQRERAIERFRTGKQANFNLAAQLRYFRQQCGQHPDLIRMLLEILADFARVDGRITESEREVFTRIATQLGVRAADVEFILTGTRTHRGGGQQRRQQGSQRRAGSSSAGDPDPYSVLGIERSASNADIKKAYRREMSRHHPDKLVSQGLPKEMIAAAEEKSRQINAAYERLASQRQIR